MDNDIKIKNPQEIHDKVMLFLGEELTSLHKRTSDQLYDIESEYSKTKKHRSAYTTVALIICCLVVGGLAFAMTRFINTSNNKIEVSLQEFDDLNLKNLLDTVSTAQVNYDNAVKNKAVLEADMEIRLKNAKDTYDNDVFVLDSMKFSSKKRYNKELEIIQQKYNANIKAVHEEFDQQVLLAEKEVESYKEQLAAFDASKVESAREQEKALDTERKLRDLEQKRITEKYEKRIAELNEKNTRMQKKHTEDIRNSVANVSKKYQMEIATLDPTINDETAKEIIQNSDENIYEDLDSELFLLENTKNPELETDFELEELLYDFQLIYDDYKYLNDVVSGIPQKNSIPNYNRATRNLVNQMGETYLTTTKDFYEETVSLNGTINTLNSTIENERKSAEERLQNQKADYEIILTNLLTVAKTSAIVTSVKTVNGVQQIGLFVSPKARYLITSDGADAEIKTTKVAKGKILKTTQGEYVFVVGTDKDGKLFEIDYSKVEPGLAIKILSK